MAPIFIEAAVSVSVPPPHDIAASETSIFASYCPGKLLRESMVAPPVTGDAAEGCCEATRAPRTELPCLLGSRVSFETASKEQGYKQSPAPAPPEHLGSVGHNHGLCRPCGFVHHKGGCSAGLACTFCHLCPPGTIEKQRTVKRQRARLAWANRNRQASAGVPTPTDGSDTPPEHDDASQSSTVDTQSRSRAETSPPSELETTAVVPSNEAVGLLQLVSLTSCPLSARSISPPASRPPQLPHLLSRARAQPPSSAHSVKDCKAKCTTSADSYVHHALTPRAIKVPTRAKLSTPATYVGKLPTKCQLRRPMRAFNLRTCPMDEPEAAAADAATCAKMAAAAKTAEGELPTKCQLRRPLHACNLRTRPLNEEEAAAADAAASAKMQQLRQMQLFFGCAQK